MKENVVTRIAPSPTGPLHVGTARSALFNYLFARQHKGVFIVRIEDTDTARSKKEFEEQILADLSWLGLTSDAVYRQSERGSIYASYVQRLMESGAAYEREEESRQEPGTKVKVIRLRNPGKNITFHDEVRGDITFNTEELGDFVIARNITEPLYHFAVVIDDFEMGITHIIRGEDHISNTPRQILIQEALGFTCPIYVHIPLILAPDRTKLSKRKGATSISDYAKDYLPEAFINYLALLGWNPGTEDEYFTLTELIKGFSLEKIQKGGAVFDKTKLDSINQHYLQQLHPDVFRAKIDALLSKTLKEQMDEEQRAVVIDTVRTHTKTFSGAAKEIEESVFYFETPKLDVKILIPKESDAIRTRTHLTHILDLLSSFHERFTPEDVKKMVWEYASKEGRGNVLWPMRYALTGREKSPDPFSVAAILGKEEVSVRLRKAIEHLT